MIFTIYFVWALTTIADLLLMAQLEFVAYLLYTFINLQFDYIFIAFSIFQSQDIPNAIALAKIFILLFITVFQIFVFCETSERLTIVYNKIDFYNDWDWFVFPIKIRRILPVIILNVQMPMKFNGFGNITCSRETFNKVLGNDVLTAQHRKIQSLQTIQSNLVIIIFN